MRRTGKLGRLDVSKSTSINVNKTKKVARRWQTGWCGSQAMYLLRVTRELYDVGRTSAYVVINVVTTGRLEHKDVSKSTLVTLKIS